MSALPELPRQPSLTPFPTDEWPTSTLPAHVDRPALEAVLAQAFEANPNAQLGETHALVVVQAGRLVLERYGEGYGPDKTYPSWSKAKSITHALLGFLVKDGVLDVMAPAAVPEWQGGNDPRGAISTDQLLRMSSGLGFTENYVPGSPSDVIEMLFGKGKDDVGAFAANFPLAYAPGTYMAYASGTTNILARMAGDRLGLKGDSFHDFMRKRLFGPLGMTSPLPKFDAAGTFIGSSFCFASARDFARFGLLYLRDGVWDGQRLLPEGWVDYARTPTYQQPGCEYGPYGAHWWLGMAGPGSFSANGYDGQYTLLVPEIDLIVVRHGATPLEQKDNLPGWMASVVDSFRG